MITEVRGVLLRDLKALRRALEVYENEGDIWKTPPGIANSGGNIALHVVGNIRAFVGAQLGGIAYTRDRDAEFSKHNVPRADLLKLVDEAITAVKDGLPKVRESDLSQPYATPAGVTVDKSDWLLHLVSHLAYHLGQLDYHRRLVTGNGATIGAVSSAELSTARQA
jgi:hypothetical protein